MQMSLLVFDFFPELLNRVVIRGVTRQLKDRQAVGLRRKEGSRSLARVVSMKTLTNAESTKQIAAALRSPAVLMDEQQFVMT